MENGKRYLRMILNIVIPFTGLVLVCVLGPRLLSFFMPFVIGWLIAMIANPLVKFFERRLRLLRRHGSMIIIVGVLGLLIGVFYLAGSRLHRELLSFIQEAPEIFEGVRMEVNRALQNSRRLLEFLPGNMRDMILEFTENLGGMLGNLFSQAAIPTVEIAGSVARSLPSILVNSVVLIVSSYLFLADYDRLVKKMKDHAPRCIHNYMEYLKKDVKGLIGGYFLAQFRIMFVVAVILFVGFLLLDVRYGLLLSILIAVLDFLPIFGTGTVLFPWALVKFFTGEFAYAVSLVVIYIVTQVVRQLIQPKIVGDSMGLPPLVTLFLLYLGFKVRGIAGMIFAVPVGLVFINFYKYGAFDPMLTNLSMLIREINHFRNGDEAEPEEGEMQENYKDKMGDM